MDRPAGGAKDSVTFLLVGSDSRGDLAPGQETQGVRATFITGQRFDSIILAHLFAGSDKAQPISFPRDSWVQIPLTRTPKTGRATPAHTAKINSSFEEGVAALLVATVEKLSGLRVDHFIQVDFQGFRSMFDQLGGVEVCLSKPAKEHDLGIDLPAGRQVIRGDQALAFVRQRKGLAQGDLDRIRRQQQFLGAIVRKTPSAGTLLEPFKLNGFLNALTHSLQVDDMLSLGSIRDIALRMRSASAAGITFTTVPVAKSDGWPAGQSVRLLDEASSQRLFDRIRRDVPPDVPDAAANPTPSPDSTLSIAPRNISVQVLNGSTVAAWEPGLPANCVRPASPSSGQPKIASGRQMDDGILRQPVAQGGAHAGGCDPGAVSVLEPGSAERSRSSLAPPTAAPDR